MKKKYTAYIWEPNLDKPRIVSAVRKEGEPAPIYDTEDGRVLIVQGKQWSDTYHNIPFRISVRNVNDEEETETDTNG